MNSKQEDALDKLQAKLIDDWNEACDKADEWGDDYPYPIFLTVDEYIHIMRGDLNVH